MIGDQFIFVNACNGPLDRLWMYTAELLSKWNGITVAYKTTPNVNSWDELVVWQAIQIVNNDTFRMKSSGIEVIDTGHGDLDGLKAANKQIIQSNCEGVKEILLGITGRKKHEKYLSIFTFGEIQGGLLQNITRQSQALGLSAYEAERNAAASKYGKTGNPWDAIYKLSNIVEHISRA